MKRNIEEMLTKIASAKHKEEPALKSDLMFDVVDKTVINRQYSNRKVVISVISIVVAAIVLVTTIIVMPDVIKDSFKNGDLLGGDVLKVEYPWEVVKVVGESNDLEPESAPWKDGKLKFTTLTLVGNQKKTGTSATTLTIGNITNFSVAQVLNNDIIQNNIELSLLNNTEILSCIDGRWLGIYTRVGDHAGCEGLFYDLENKNYVCVACRLLELIRSNEYYIDACVRNAVELYGFETEKCGYGKPWPHLLEDNFQKLYKAFYESDAPQVFAKGEKLTAENAGMKVSGFYENEWWEHTKLDEFEYPVVKVLEYGQDVNKCFFAIVAPDDNIAWGSFVYDFSENKLYSLNGDLTESGSTIIGNSDENAMYHYTTYSQRYPQKKAPKSPNNLNEYYTVMAELAFATHVTVSTDYNYIAVSAPYFSPDDGFSNYETGIVSDIYEEDIMYIVDVKNGTCRKMFEFSDDDCSYYYEIHDTDGPWPAGKPQFLEGEICYPTKRGTWRFDRHVELKGELIKLVTVNGSVFAFMKQAGVVRVYSVYDGTEITEDISDIIESESYYNVEVELTEILNNENGSIADGKYVAATSKTGRYVYLFYEYIGRVLCIDRETNETTTIEVDKEMISAARQLDNVNYQLFLSDDATQLFLTYYNDCRVVFESDALFGRTFWGLGADNYESSQYIQYITSIDYEYITECFSKNNTSVYFDRKSKQNYIKCVEILSCDLVAEYSELVKMIPLHTNEGTISSMLTQNFSLEIIKISEKLSKDIVFDGKTMYFDEKMIDRCLEKTGRTYAEFNDYYRSFQKKYTWNIGK